MHYNLACYDTQKFSMPGIDGVASHSKPCTPVTAPPWYLSHLYGQRKDLRLQAARVGPVINQNSL